MFSANHFPSFKLGIDAAYREKMIFLTLDRSQERGNQHEAGWPPFEVVLVDQFEGHSEDGYGTWGKYDSFEEAMAEAWGITEEAIKKSRSIQG